MQFGGHPGLAMKASCALPRAASVVTPGNARTAQCVTCLRRLIAVARQLPRNGAGRAPQRPRNRPSAGMTQFHRHDDSALFRAELLVVVAHCGFLVQVMHLSLETAVTFLFGQKKKSDSSGGSRSKRPLRPTGTSLAS